MAYTSVDYTLNHLIRLLSTPGLTVNSKIQKLKLELDFLRTFLRWTAKRCFQENGNSEGLLPQIDVVIHNSGRYLESISSDAVEDIVKGLDQFAPKVLEKIETLKPEIEEVYINLARSLPFRLTSTLMDILEVEEFLNSLIENLNDLLIYCSKSTILPQLRSLETKLRFLRNLLRFAAPRCSEHEKLKDLSTHAESVAVEAAYISFMFSFDPINEDLKDKLAELLLKIDPATPEIKGIYVGVIRALRPLTAASQIADAELSISIDTIQALRPLMKETHVSNAELSIFIDTIREYLTELLNQHPSWMASLKVNIEDLHHELTFLSSYVKDPPMQSIDNGKWTNPIDHTVDDLQRELTSWNNFDSLAQPPKHYIELLKLKGQLTNIEALAIDVGGVIFSCFDVDETDKKKPGKTDIALVDDFVEKIKCIKAEIKVSIWKLPEVNISRTDDLGFVKNLARNLMELLVSQAGPTASLKHQVQGMQNELEILSSFLENCGESRQKHKILMKSASDIIYVAHSAEYVIDSCLVRDGPLWYHSLCLAAVIQEMKRIRTEVESLNGKMNTYHTEPEIAYSISPSRGTTGHSKPPDEDNEVVPLFQEDMEKIKNELMGGQSKRDVIAIVGMPGLGKTTLARRVYNDPSIVSRFDLRAFAQVSQVYDTGKLVLEILRSVTDGNDTFNERDVDELRNVLYKCLYGRRYLIVLDDVWDVAAWDAFSLYFPDNGNESRILLTTRQTEVASSVAYGDHIHHLRFLTLDESWELFHKKIFKKKYYPKELEEVAQRIVEQCQGLPIAIVLIAGILASTEANVESWEQVRQSTQIGKNDDFASIIDLSYQNLSDWLRQCFIYFGAFPMNEEIAVSKLIRLWTAEGFIQQTAGKNLEDVAMSYLEYLIGRNLVMICRRSSLGAVKSCTVHNLFHAFCSKKAKQENTFQLMERYNDSTLPNSATCEHRRLCIPSDWKDYASSKVSGPLVRSLVLTSRITYFSRFACDVSFLSQNFKLLKVLDLACLNVGTAFPVGLENMILLRYLAIRGEMTSIPSSIVSLQQLETFITIGLSGEVAVPDSIWSLTKLRHLHINDRASFAAPDYRQEVLKLPLLRTMSSPLLIHGEESQKIMEMLPGLEKLKCILLESWDKSRKKNMFPNLELLPELRALKLFYYGRKRVACQFSLPSTLTRLTLSRFCLPWDQISTIGRLPNLEVLKLLNKAFEGREWKMNDGEFSCLKVLRLDRLNLEEWHATSESLPNLERLELQKCKQLNELPGELAEIDTLQMIEVKWCGKSVAISAKDIQEEQESLGNRPVEVLIYPAESGDLPEN